MKIPYYIFYFMLTCLISACSNADYAVIDNAVYINDASATTDIAMAISMDRGAEIPILVRLAKPVQEDVEVEIRLSADLVDEYNRRTEGTFLRLTDFALPPDAKVTIPAGNISATYTLHIPDFETNGERYAVGVRLGNVLRGNVQPSPSQSSFVYLLTRALRVSVPILSGGPTRIDALPSTPWGITTNQWSLEFWANMSAFSINNQAVFNTGSEDHEIYIRFGDANRPFNYLQIKTLGGQIQTASDLVANRWYHWTFVYDGIFLNIYRDGVLDVRFQPPTPINGAVRFDYFQMISSGAAWFRDQCRMGQVRLWRTAISPAQIRNNMYFEMNPNHPDLLGFWPMDEGSGVEFRDISTNGRHAVAGQGIVRGWEDGVNFRND